MPVGDRFAVDFNIGLGFEYDLFYLIDGVRTYKAKSLSKDFWGPSQAGVSLVWRIDKSK